MNDPVSRLLPANTRARNKAPPDQDRTPWFEVTPGLWIPQPFVRSRDLLRIRAGEKEPPVPVFVAVSFDLNTLSLTAIGSGIEVGDLRDAPGFIGVIADEIAASIRSVWVSPETPLRTVDRGRDPGALQTLDWPQGKPLDTKLARAQHRQRNAALRTFVAAADEPAPEAIPIRSRMERMLSSLGAQPCPTDISVTVSFAQDQTLLIEVEHEGDVAMLSGDQVIRRLPDSLAIESMPEGSLEDPIRRYSQLHLLLVARCVEASWGRNPPETTIMMTTGRIGARHKMVMSVAPEGWHLPLIEMARYLAGKCAVAPECIRFM